MTAYDLTIRDAKAVTVSDSAEVGAGRYFVINCTVAGDVTVRLRSGATHVIAAAVGYARFPYGVVGVNTTGTTATATYTNLY